MTTFAGQMDFDGPQPFNVDPWGMDKDRDLYPARPGGRLGRRMVARPAIPVVAQEITPDRNLYPPATPRRHRGKIG